MGWFRDDPAHEGYVVALVLDESGSPGWPRLRELTARDDVAPSGIRPAAFQVGCDCGWRSRLYHPPLAARWHPSMLDLNDSNADEESRKLWAAHYEAEQADVILRGGNVLTDVRPPNKRRMLMPYTGPGHR